MGKRRAFAKCGSINASAGCGTPDLTVNVPGRCFSTVTTVATDLNMVSDQDQAVVSNIHNIRRGAVLKGRILLKGIKQCL